MAHRLHKFLQELRAEKGELLKDMAEKLDLGSVELSSIEHGKTSMPKGFMDKIQRLYIDKNKPILRIEREMKVDVRDYKRIEFYHDATGHEGILYPSTISDNGSYTYYYIEADPRWYMGINFELANKNFNSPENNFDRWIFVKGEPI